MRLRGPAESATCVAPIPSGNDVNGHQRRRWGTIRI